MQLLDKQIFWPADQVFWRPTQKFIPPNHIILSPRKTMRMMQILAQVWSHDVAPVVKGDRAACQVQPSKIATSENGFWSMVWIIMAGTPLSHPRCAKSLKISSSKCLCCDTITVCTTSKSIFLTDRVNICYRHQN